MNQQQGHIQQHEYSEEGAGSSYRVIIWVIVAILILAVGYFGFVFAKGDLGGDDAAFVGSEGYHAVFLSNKLTYFSKIEESGDGYLKLSDIYYLRVQQQIQPIDPNQQGQPEITLIKLGGEIHGPEDTMYVNREHVLFVEPLKADSNVVNAIAREKEESAK